MNKEKLEEEIEDVSNEIRHRSLRNQQLDDDKRYNIDKLHECIDRMIELQRQLNELGY